MKIYFGFDNSRDLKVSSSVADKGLNLLKCKPIAFPMFGLRSIIQPGYDSYISSIPSFMKATETGKPHAISSIGNSTKLSMTECFPILLPKVFLMIKKAERIDKVIGSEKKYVEIFTRKEGTAYSVDFEKDMLRIGQHQSVLENTFPVDRHMKPGDIPVAVRILQMLSSLCRTHKYPAFSDDDGTLANKEKMYGKEKMSFKRSSDATDRKVKGKMVKVEGTDIGTFHGLYKEDILDSLTYKIELKKAKPTTSSIKPWGATNEIPTTPGINFPFDEDLCQPDGETVPLLIERYLLPCIHDNPETSVKLFSDMVASWKTTLCRTIFGMEMTHLAKVFLTALPAQARVFPIIQDSHYLGSYMSGAHFSVGIKGVVYAADSYENNILELSCYSSNDQILKKLAVLCSTNAESQNKIIALGPNIRRIGSYLNKTLVIGSDGREKIMTLAATLRPEIPYRKVNTANLEWCMNLLISGKYPDLNEPMAATSMFSFSNHFETVMSAFGSNIPSVEIPGAPKWKIDGTEIPKKMVGVFAVRLCSMEIAKADWFKMRETDIIHNCPERLSAIYEHTVIRGKEDKSKIWGLVYSWCSSEDQIRDRERAGLGEIVTAAAMGGSVVTGDLFEDTGF